MNREAMEVRLRREAGMSPEKKEAMSKFLKAQDDWYTHCDKCGEKLMGLPTDIMIHAERCHGETSQ